MDVASVPGNASAQASPSAGPNPWESDTIRSAVTTLNDTKASIDDQITAYKAITDLISSQPTQGGPPRVAVVTSAGFKAFAAKENVAAQRFNIGAGGHDTPNRQLKNFDAMSSDDQKLISISPTFNGAGEFRAHLQASAGLSDLVNEALASGHFASIHQVTDKKYDGLKAFIAGGYQPTNAWTARAEQFLATRNTPAPSDNVELSPAAQAVVSLTQPPPVDSAGAVALKTLQAQSDARDKEEARTKSTARSQGLATSVGDYLPGAVASKTA